uniref:Uncharacterized protein n=1 Tax=Manihot esculenta TaxID=3983 RepID=A0A2C9U3I4_MANES
MIPKISTSKEGLNTSTAEKDGACTETYRRRREERLRRLASRETPLLGM